MILKTVTLICVEGSNSQDEIAKSIKSLLISSSNIEFGEIVLVSPDNLPDVLPEKIKHYVINPMTWLEYNQFIVSELTNYVNTDFCILVQSDGFIINGHLWTEEFLQYDYIGHVWDFVNLPFHLPGVDPEVVAAKGAHNLNRVGNGGFSLRSKKLLNASATITSKCEKGEDAFICNDHYDYLTEQKGIVFGTVEIARKFSEDPTVKECASDSPTFGFHGIKDLINKY